MLATATGLAYIYSKYSRLPRVELGSTLSEDVESGEPRNVLIVGIDSAAGLDPNDPVRATRQSGGLRSDTMMILRLDPASERASLLSLPRDLWVPIPGSTGNQRINVAVNQGGPQRLIETIQEYFNVPIHHYMQIDFAGFQDLVAAVGGVPLYFPTPVRDKNSGLLVEKAGCITLSPSQALAYVRSRAYQFLDDGRWRTDPTGDLGRISRQQDFIRRAVKRAISRGVRNPATLNRLINVGLDSVAVDDSLTADDMLRIANRFRSFNANRLQMYSLPVDDDVVGGAAVLRLRDAEAQPILDLFRGADPATLAAPLPSSVRVRVLNGSGRSGEARGAMADLRAVGFGDAGTGEADSFSNPRTIVQYAPGGAANADLVARWLVAGAELREVADLVGGDVVVVTGRDYAGVRDTAAASTSSSSTSSSSSTTSTTSGSTSSSISTTTTVVGEVPIAPPNTPC